MLAIKLNIRMMCAKGKVEQWVFGCGPAFLCSIHIGRHHAVWQVANMVNGYVACAWKDIGE